MRSGHGDGIEALYAPRVKAKWRIRGGEFFGGWRRAEGGIGGEQGLEGLERRDGLKKTRCKKDEVRYDGKIIK